VNTGFVDHEGYHCHARTVDHTGRASAWVAYGSNPESEPDFLIALPPAAIAFLADPPNAVAGTPVAPAIQVAARDASGDIVTSYGGDVSIALVAHASGALLAGTTTVTAVSRDVLRPGNRPTRGGFNLRANAGGLAVTSGQFNARQVRPPAGLQWQPVPQPPRRCWSHGPGRGARRWAMATGFNGDITAALSAGPSAAVLSGTVV
jgi:hypothetical protein